MSMTDEAERVTKLEERVADLEHALRMLVWHIDGPERWTKDVLELLDKPK